MKKMILFGFIGFVFWSIITVMSQREVEAIPAFARKYKTSCATCHTSFPRLTAFGESFRRNGFQFPEGTDLEYIKEEPVQLGAEGNKRAFPDAIWPGSIPGTAPFAMIVESALTYNDEADPKIDFTSFPGDIAVVAGGTFGESIAFYSELGFSEEGIEIERVYASLLNMVGPYSLVNLKIGQFEPGVFYFSNHRRLGPRYLISGVKVGDNNWSLEPLQQGFELYGTSAQGRLGYNVGLVEGSGNIVNTAKDVYAHLTYKFGGLRLDGVAPEASKPFQKSKPWEDNSVIFGAFGYTGKAKLGESGEESGQGGAPLAKTTGILQQGATLNDNFQAFGADMQIYYGRWNLFGGYAFFDYDNPFLLDPTRSADASVGFGEAQFTAYPWLIPYARYEAAEIADETLQRFIPGFAALLRANVRIEMFGEFTKEPGADFGFKALAAAFVFGF